MPTYSVKFGYRVDLYTIALTPVEVLAAQVRDLRDEVSTLQHQVHTADDVKKMLDNYLLKIGVEEISLADLGAYLEEACPGRFARRNG